MKIREYQPEDAPALAAIYYNTIHHINKADYNQQQIHAWAPETHLDPNFWAEKWDRIVPIVAELDGRPVGFVEFESTGYIDCFYCHHEVQGKGVGRALMNEVFKRAREQGIDRIYADVSITAKPFFEKMGFQVEKAQTVEIRGMKLDNFMMSISITY